MSPFHSAENAALFLPFFILAIRGASSISTPPGAAVGFSVGLSCCFWARACNSAYSAFTVSCAARRGFSGP